MKLTFFLLLLLPLGLEAQIVLTQANVPAAGDTLFYGRDTSVADIDIGMAGADQAWDFSQLQAETTFQLIASDTTMDEDVENYPGANLIITAEQVKTFIESSDTAVYILGGGVPEAAAFGLEVVKFIPPQKLFEFPATYGTEFINTYAVDATVAGALIDPSLDSVRLVRRATATVVIDAYGTVKTPLNNYETLRQRTETVNADSIYVRFFGNWFPFLADTSVSLQYDWLTAESKGRAVTVYVDAETGIPENAEFFLDVDNASAPEVSFTIEDQGEGTFAFSDQSTNAPTSWQWTFGDGNGSEEQNPVHTYTEEGQYQVCLTATNFVGSNQICQTIMVDMLSGTLDPGLQIQLQVYPNPTDQFVWIRPLGLDTDQFDFQLFNQQGKGLLQRQFAGQLRLDLHELPPGIYTYFLKTTDGRTARWGSGKIQVAR